ncbi:MAG: polysaccharide biosynthesis/export family protein, partial [bacterium]
MLKHFKTCLLALLMTLVCSTAIAESVEKPSAGAQKNTKADSYLVEAGDLLGIVVWKNEELSADYIVRPDGKITIPLIGDIIASGKSTDNISLQIKLKLKEFIESPFVTVIIREAISNKVYVLGEVRNPGLYRIHGSLSVLQVIALAGGFTEFANREKMVLIRMK